MMQEMGDEKLLSRQDRVDTFTKLFYGVRIQIVYFDFSVFGLYNWLVDNDGLIHIRFHGLTSSC
jgi:NADH:ubiquinone oxidoreductase subunit 3 (subunit A)